MKWTSHIDQHYEMYIDMLIGLLGQAYKHIGNEPCSEVELQQVIFIKENIKFTLEDRVKYYERHNLHEG